MTNSNSNSTQASNSRRTFSLPKINCPSTTTDFSDDNYDYNCNTSCGTTASSSEEREPRKKKHLLNQKRLRKSTSTETNGEEKKSASTTNLKQNKCCSKSYSWLSKELWSNKLPIINNKPLSLSTSWTRAHFDLIKYKRTLEQ